MLLTNGVEYNNMELALEAALRSDSGKCWMDQQQGRLNALPTPDPSRDGRVAPMGHRANLECYVCGKDHFWRDCPMAQRVENLKRRAANGRVARPAGRGAPQRGARRGSAPSRGKSNARGNRAGGARGKPRGVYAMKAKETEAKSGEATESAQGESEAAMSNDEDDDFDDGAGEDNEDYVDERESNY